MGELTDDTWVKRFVNRYSHKFYRSNEEDGGDGDVYFESSPLTQALNSISGIGYNTLYESTRYSARGGATEASPVREAVEIQLKDAEMYDNFEIPVGVAVFLGKSEDGTCYEWNAVFDKDGSVEPFQTDFKGVPINQKGLNYINFIIKPKNLDLIDDSNELLNRYRNWDICNETYTGGYSGGVLGMDQLRGTGLF